MIKTLFKKQDFIYIFLIVSFFALFLTLSNGTYSPDTNLENTFFCIRDCYILYSDKGTDQSMNMIEALAYIMCLIPIICKTFISDFDVAKSYLFVRMKSTSIWFAYKTFQCAVYCFFSAVMYNSTIMITLMIFKCKADNPMIALRNLIYGILVSFLFLFMFCTLGNTLSLKFDQHISVIIVLTFIIFMIVLSIFVGGENAHYLLTSHYFVSTVIKDSESYSLFFTCPAWTYYTILTTITVILPLIGNRILKKSDQL